MAQTNIQTENLQRAITQKIKIAELWFMCTAFPHNVFYQCMKYQVNNFYSFQVTAWTKIKVKINKGQKLKK